MTSYSASLPAQRRWRDERANARSIIITWDDWGGWYDHVPPSKVLLNCAQWGCGYVYGFRVPLIVVSPYAKPAYISHTPHDFGSILRFIEENVALPSLNYADAYADNLSDCFNFSQTPLKFQTIPAAKCGAVSERSEAADRPRRRLSLPSHWQDFELRVVETFADGER